MFIFKQPVKIMETDAYLAKNKINHRTPFYSEHFLCTV